MMFGIERKDNVHLVVSPLYHTAVLTFSDRCTRAHVVLMDKWTPRERSSGSRSTA